MKKNNNDAFDSRFGVVFLGESSGYYVVRVQGRVKAFRRLEVLEFTSGQCKSQPVT